MNSQGERQISAKWCDYAALHLSDNSISIEISHFGSDQKLYFMNEETRSFLGLPSTATIAFSIREVIGQKPYNIAGKHVNRTVDGETFRFDIVRLCKGIREIPINLTHSPHVNPAGVEK